MGVSQAQKPASGGKEGRARAPPREERERAGAHHSGTARSSTVTAWWRGPCWRRTAR